MRNDRLSQFVVIFIVIVAFVDGMLFAQKLQEKEGTQAVEITPLETLINQEVTPVTAEPELKDPAFISQAPLWDWKSPWSDFAEEAVITMAQNWIDQKTPESAREAADQLLITWEKVKTQFQGAKQLTIEQIQTFFSDSRIINDPSLKVLIQAFEGSKVLVVPVNGQILQNPHYSDPAPTNHLILIFDYNAESNQFIAHDPGTNRGEAVAYDAQKILESIQDLDGQIRVLEITNP